MKTNPSWADALNISASQLDAWTAEAPADQPVLFYALERGLIASGEYLDWAREHFALPTIDNAFFDDACDLELVRGAHQLESYHPWFFPVGRWDDVIYVACVEPTDDLPPGYCLVLADAQKMLRAWDAAATAGDPVIDAPAGLYVGETKPFALDLDALTLVDEPIAEPAPRPVAPAAPSIPAPVFEITAPAPIEAAPEEGAVLVEHKGTRVASAAAALTASRSFYSNSPDDVRLNLPSAEAGALTRVFEFLNESYANACVLRRNESMIRLYKHSLGMNPSGQGVAIDLSYPSFLRIVARTGQAYHGYVVDSPTHREFFRGLGITDLPGSVTATPLIIEGQFWGVLMVTGRADQQSAAALKPVDSAARQLVEALSTAWRKAAA